jgi:hypothetical protein
MKRIALLASMVVAALVLAAPAYAGGGSTATRVTIHRNAPFHGRVKTRHHKRSCRGGRTVRIYEVQPSANKLIASTTSASDGFYEVAVNTHHSTYFAVATRLVRPNGYVCRRGQSHQINFQK